MVVHSPLGAPVHRRLYLYFCNFFVSLLLTTHLYTLPHAPYTSHASMYFFTPQHAPIHLYTPLHPSYNPHAYIHSHTPQHSITHLGIPLHDIYTPHASIHFYTPQHAPTRMYTPLHTPIQPYTPREAHISVAHLSVPEFVCMNNSGSVFHSLPLSTLAKKLLELAKKLPSKFAALLSYICVHLTRLVAYRQKRTRHTLPKTHI